MGSFARRCTETRPAAAPWGNELRKGLVSCNLTVGTVWRYCFHNELCSVAGTVHGDDSFVAGPRQYRAKMEATLKKSWETGDQMIGPKPDDQKGTPHSQSYAAMVQGWVGLRGEHETWQRGCRQAGTEQVEASLVSGHGRRRQDDEFKSLNEEEKRLYQRIVAKLTNLAHDPLDLKYATSCLACAVSSPSLGGHASSGASWTILEESTGCLARFLFS